MEYLALALLGDPPDTPEFSTLLARVAKSVDARDFPPVADLLKLIYCDYFDDYTQARCREIWLKSGQGRDWLKKQGRD